MLRKLYIRLIAALLIVSGVQSEVNSQVVAHAYAAGGSSHNYSTDWTSRDFQLFATASTGAITKWSWKPLDFTNQPTNMRLEDTMVQNPWVKTMLPGVTIRYELTVHDASGNFSKDTAFLTVGWANPPPQGNLHKVTFADSSAVEAVDPGKHARIGIDWILTGANDLNIGTGGANVNFYNHGLSGQTFPPGCRILVNATGNKFGAIDIGFAGAIITATNANPIIFTPYGGQLRCTNLNFVDAVNLWVDGDYVPGVSGFAGFEGFSTGKWSWRYNKFAIDVDNGWKDLGGAAIGFSGYSDSCKITSVRAGGGTFTAMFNKQHNVDSAHIYNIFRGFVVDKCLFFQTHGEGIYWGDTAGDSIVTFDGSGNRLPPTIYQHVLTGATISNSIFQFTGNEGMQLGDIVKISVHNNAIYLTALNNFSPFDELQDQSIQLDLRNGGTRWFSNWVDRAGRYHLNLFIQSKHREPGLGAFNGDSNLLYNNAFFHSLGDINNYMTGRDSLAQELTRYRDNYSGFCWFDNNINYISPDARAIFKKMWIQADDQSNNNFFSFKNNHFDNSRATGAGSTLIQGDAKMDSSGNIIGAAIPYLSFNYTGWGDWNLTDSFMGRKARRYVGIIYREYGDEYPNKRVFGVAQGDTMTFAAGEVVTHLGRWYKSRQNNNRMHYPNRGDSTWWQLMTWIDPFGNIVEEPPADVRLVAGSFYANLGIGLTAIAPLNPTVSATGNNIQLPTTTTSISSSATPQGGHSITLYRWSQVFGPATAGIASPNTANTNITGLTAQGTYAFEIYVEQDDGGYKYSIATVTVGSVVNRNYHPFLRGGRGFNLIKPF